MTEKLWTLTDVGLGSPSRPRLENVSTTLESGCTVLVGPSGAGKTSLLNLLAGYEKPDTGSVLVEFARSSQPLPLFWVPHSLGLWPHLTVREHLEVVLPASSDMRVYQADDLLACFDLSDDAEVKPDSLSQGEKSRLAVARALAAHPQILVLDEPLVHVNPTYSGRYWKTFQEYLEQTSSHLVFSTHSPEIALRESTQILCLKGGQLVYAGKTEELYYSPPDEELASYLGVTNWFHAEEATRWLQQATTSPIHYRPEQLELVEAEEGPFEIARSYSVGSHLETDLIDHHTSETRRVYTRAERFSKPLKAGQKAFLRSVMLLMLLVGTIVFSGCDSTASARIDVQSERYWMLPTQDNGLPAPRGLGVSNDQDLIVLDNAGRVLIYSPDRELKKQWWMPEYDVGKPEGVVQLKDGRFVVADTHYHRIVFFDEQGKYLNSIGSLGQEPGQFIYPVAITEDDQENIYVCEYGGNDRIQKFDKSGKLLKTFGSFGMEPEQFQRPSGITWSNGKIYVADAINNRIQIYSDEGKHEATWGTDKHPLQLHYPYDIEVAPQGHFFVVEYGAGRVTELDQNGKLVARYGSIGANSEQFTTPWGITVDANRNVYVADTGNRRIVQLKVQ